jgi:hypothetical protein
MPLITPPRFTSMTLRVSSIGMSSKKPATAIPALLKSRSRRPPVSSATSPMTSS